MSQRLFVEGPRKEKVKVFGESEKQHSLHLFLIQISIASLEEKENGTLMKLALQSLV